MKNLAWLKKPQGILALALVLIILGSLFAGMFNTSFYGVKVTEIEFTTERGTLNGLLYMPKGAGESDPRPVIVTTHGYLNTKEMQDAPAIEMSRRGYIVLALDMYDHGDSRWAAEFPTSDMFSTFWIWSQYDAAAYMYQQPYTLKAADGHGYIAVSGHSMGGFSTVLALYWDSAFGTNYIHAGLPVGADLLYAGMVAPNEELLAAFGDRTVGFIGGQFDEFFFAHEDTPRNAGSVRQKNFVDTAIGKTILGLPVDGEAGVSGQFYTVDGAQRVIYTPYQTHPWNHFSKTATAHMIDFYQHAFADVTPASMENAGLDQNNQIWMWKEFFNCVALVGFFMLIVPLIQLLLKLPVFRWAITPEVEPVAPAKGLLGHLLAWLGIAAGALLPAILFSTLMDKTALLHTLGVAALVLAECGVAATIIAFVCGKKNHGYGGIILTVLFGLLSALFFKADAIVPLGHFFNEPTVNQIAYWALFSGLLTALLVFGFYCFSKVDQGTTLKNYGLRWNPIAIAASLLTAVVAVVGAYAVLFLTQWIFGVDYRVWVLAVRTFKVEHVITALRYMPIFFVYYFFNAMAINANTRGKKWIGDGIAKLMNVGGLVIWVALQYGLLFSRGVALQPDQALNGILLFALIPCLTIAALYARRLFAKTNNVWLAAFLNTILFTMITCANTAMFWNMVG